MTRKKKQSPPRRSQARRPTRPAKGAGEAAEAASRKAGKRPVEDSEAVEQLESQLEATCEDLQSTIEELESANEALDTVNNELQSKLQELEGVDNDITNLLACADIAALFLDADMRIRRLGPATARLLGFVPGDVGRPISESSAEVTDDELVPDARRVLESLTPIEKEVWSEEPEPRCYLRRIVPYRTADRRIEGVVITFVDVTEGRRGHQELEKVVTARTAELRQSRHRLQSVVDNALDAIITIDARGVVDLFNPAAEAMFGYRAEEVIGRNVSLLMPPPHREAHDDYIRAYLQTGEAQVIGAGRKVEGRRKDGSVFPLHLAVSEFTQDDLPMFVGTLHDLTAEEEAALALRREHALSESIVSTAQVVILRLDEQGRIVSFNPYMERLSGWSLEEVAGKDWFETFLPERDRVRIRELFERAVGGEATRGNINPIVTKDGQERLLEWYDSRLRLPGQPVTLLCVGQDVTAREQLEQEYLQAQKMEAVGRLAGGVAHDFNNLLAGVMSGLRIASKVLGQEHAAREVLDDVVAELERGARMTRHLLDFSRTGTPEPGPLDPRETVRSAEAMIRRLLGEDVEVQVACDEGGAFIRADAGQLEQALLNLAVNARDAMPRGGRLTIECRERELSAEDVEALGASTPGPGRCVVLAVADTGSGMDEETRRRAADSFFTTKPAGRGTGLGLSSVAAMMTSCGGHLALESDPGAGTTVRLVFPALDAQSVTEAPERALRVAEPCHGGGETVLVVEDEKLVRLGVQHILEDLGYAVLVAGDPESALAELEREGVSVDLLLTDVVLPRVSGPELAAVVRDRHPGVAVLYMSAFPADELVAQGRIPAGTATLEKPFTEEAVARMVRRALEQPEASPGG